MVEEKIINNCKIRQRKLLRRAKIAFDKPDTGVTIEKRGAYFLIKDSADITLKYLAHLAYSSFTSPISDLKGKFTQAEIIDFVGRSKVHPETRQLLHIILTDIGSAQLKLATDGEVEVIVGETVEKPVFDYGVSGDEDVYGDYDIEADSETSETVVVDPKEEVNVDDVTAVINKLIEVFEAK